MPPIFYVTRAKNQPMSRLPIPSVATIFEVVANRRVYTVTGKALQQWIDKRREAWKGPRGLLFSQRPTLE